MGTPSPYQSITVTRSAPASIKFAGGVSTGLNQGGQESAKGANLGGVPKNKVYKVEKRKTGGADCGRGGGV